MDTETAAGKKDLVGNEAAYSYVKKGRTHTRAGDHNPPEFKAPPTRRMRSSGKPKKMPHGNYQVANQHAQRASSDRQKQYEEPDGGLRWFGVTMAKWAQSSR
jgi:hypothetical protein